MCENLNAKTIEVKHADLEEVSESQLRRECPVCKPGILLLRRDDTTFKLLAEDICISCGQKVVYTDIETLRDRERPERKGA